MKETLEPVEWIKHAATCHKCGKNLVLNQDPACPSLLIEKWLPLIVCERCGDYLKEYSRIDDAIFVLVFGRQDRQTTRARLIELTTRANRMFCRYWVTTFDWNEDWVDLILDKPSGCRASMRVMEKLHERARREADKRPAQTEINAMIDRNSTQ